MGLPSSYTGPSSEPMTTRQVRARLASDGKAVPLSSTGTPATYDHTYCNGSAFFVHRPQQESSAVPHSARLRRCGANYSFEFQIQCRFKARPRGTVFISAELRDAPMQLNLVTRALCRVLLAFMQKQAARRGIELRYSFGDATSLPNITFPLFAADRLIISDELAPLPIDTDEDKGTWHYKDGKLTPIDRTTLVLDEEHYLTIMFATSYVDLNNWCLTGIPGVRNLDLAQFWGAQPMHVAFTEDDPITKRRIFFELELDSVFTTAEELEKLAEPAPNKAATEAVLPTNTVVELADAALEEPEAMSPEGLEEDKMSYYSADEDRDSDVDDQQQESSDDEPEPGDEDWDVQSKISSHSKGIVDRLNGSGLARQTSNFDDLSDLDDLVPADNPSDSLAIPWYFLNGAGDLWWCIKFRGRTCWRHNSHLRALCSALGTEHLPLDGRSSVQELEAGRRMASRLLEQGCNAPGLLEEFTCAEVELGSLLSGEVRPTKQAVFVGVVEAEGRIAERYARLQGETLRWRIHGGRRKTEEVSIELKRSEVSVTSIAGAQAVLLRTPQKGFVLVAKDAAHHKIMMECLEKYTLGGGREEPTPSERSAGAATPSSSSFAVARVQDLWSAVRRNVASFAAMVPGSTRAMDTATSVHQRAAVAATTVQQKAVEAANSVHQKAASAATTVQQKAAVHILRQAAPWHDPLLRWPRSRIVVNNAELWLDTQTAPALQFSAELLRSALAAQGGPESAVQELTARSCALKCVSLGGLAEQDLWCFWVNVFHCLVVHAQLVAGKPRMFHHMVSFFNNCSYVVAGHAFSLAEIEHCILRRHMTKPRVRIVRSILKIWPRTEEDLENRPCMNAPPCSASCFGCRADWRVNLVLNAGNHGSSDCVPVFEPMSESAFEATVRCAMERTLSSCGNSGKDTVELPYTLCRYRDDAPPGLAGDTHERRWVRAIMPELLEANTRVSYRSYGWTMRPKLLQLPEGDLGSSIFSV